MKKLTIAISPAKKPRGLLHRKQDTSAKLVKPAMFGFDGVVKQLLKGVGKNIFCQGIRVDAFLEIPLGGSQHNIHLYIAFLGQKFLLQGLCCSESVNKFK